MAWNKSWKGQDLEHVEDITRADLDTGLTSNDGWLVTSRLLGFGPYLFSDPSHNVFFEPEDNLCNKRAPFKDSWVILTTRNRAPSLSTTIVHHCIQIFT